MLIFQRMLLWFAQSLLQLFSFIGFITEAEAGLLTQRVRSAIRRRGRVMAPVAATGTKIPKPLPSSQGRDHEVHITPIISNRKYCSPKGHFGLVDSDDELEVVLLSASMSDSASVVSPYTLKLGPLDSARESTRSLPRYDDAFVKSMESSLKESAPLQVVRGSSLKSFAEQYSPTYLSRSPKVTPARLAYDSDVQKLQLQIADKTANFEKARGVALSEQRRSADAHYEALAQSERTRRAQSLIENTARELTASLQTLLDADKLDIESIEALLPRCLGAVDPALHAEAASVTSATRELLRSVDQTRERYANTRSRADEAELQALLTSPVGHRVRHRNEVVDAKEFLLLTPAVDEAETPAPEVATDASVRFAFSYVNAADSRLAWFRTVSKSFDVVSLSGDAAASLADCLSEIRRVPSSGARADMEATLRAAASVSSMFKQHIDAMDNNCVLFVISAILREVVEQLMEKGDAAVHAYAVLTQAVHHSLGASLKTVFSNILIRHLIQESRACIPDFSEGVGARSAVCVAFVGVLADNNCMSSMGIRAGWLWLSNAAKQLYLLSKCGTDAAVLGGVCGCISQFLRRCHISLQCFYGSSFRSLLKELLHLVAIMESELAQRLQRELELLLDVNKMAPEEAYPAHFVRNKIFIG